MKMESPAVKSVLSLARTYGLLQASVLLLKEVEEKDSNIVVIEQMVMAASVELETFYVASLCPQEEYP